MCICILALDDAVEFMLCICRYPTSWFQSQSAINYLYVSVELYLTGIHHDMIRYPVRGHPKYISQRSLTRA